MQCVLYSDEHILGETKPVWKEVTVKTSKRTKFKLSDSIEAMILTCKSDESPDEQIARVASEKHTHGLHFHPLIVVIMNDQGVPDKFWLYYNSVTIVIPSFVQALEALMKHYLVFNFQYQSESAHVCHFFAHYFFGIKIGRIPGLTAIQKLMDLLQ